MSNARQTDRQLARSLHWGSQVPSSLKQISSYFPKHRFRLEKILSHSILEEQKVSQSAPDSLRKTESIVLGQDFVAPQCMSTDLQSIPSSIASISEQIIRLQNILASHKTTMDQIDISIEEKQQQHLAMQRATAQIRLEVVQQNPQVKIYELEESMKTMKDKHSQAIEHYNNVKAELHQDNIQLSKELQLLEEQFAAMGGQASSGEPAIEDLLKQQASLTTQINEITTLRDRLMTDISHMKDVAAQSEFLYKKYEQIYSKLSLSRYVAELQQFLQDNSSKMMVCGQVQRIKMSIRKKEIDIGIKQKKVAVLLHEMAATKETQPKQKNNQQVLMSFLRK